MMEDVEMDESFYKKLKESVIKWELPIIRPMLLFDTDKARAEFEQSAKETKEKELSDLRDHFAGLALSGIFANHLCNPETDEHFNNIALISYRAADAMLQQRSLTND